MIKAVIEIPFPEGCRDCVLLESHDGYSSCPLNEYSGWYGDVPEDRDEHCPIKGTRVTK